MRFAQMCAGLACADTAASCQLASSTCSCLSRVNFQRRKARSHRFPALSCPCPRFSLPCVSTLPSPPLVPALAHVPPCACPSPARWAVSGASSCQWSWDTLTTTSTSWGPSQPPSRVRGSHRSRETRRLGGWACLVSSRTALRKHYRAFSLPTSLARAISPSGRPLERGAGGWAGTRWAGPGHESRAPGCFTCFRALPLISVLLMRCWGHACACLFAAGKRALDFVLKNQGLIDKT